MERNNPPLLPIIEINNLHKSYGSNKVLNGIDLKVFPGQIIGYIGPNGAGKSTTVRILSGLDKDFSGSVTLAGIDVSKSPLEVKKKVGYVPENAALYEVLTPTEFLLFVGRLHDMEDDLILENIARWMDFFGLSNHLDERIDTFSKGMRQKVLLTSGLLHDPEIIFLDEPLAGLDANSVILVKELINKMAESGKTIFYSSHMMDVVEKISDRIVLIHSGKIIADGHFETLKSQGDDTLEKVFAQLTGGASIDDQIDKLTAYFTPKNNSYE